MALGYLLFFFIFLMALWLLLFLFTIVVPGSIQLFMINKFAPKFIKELAGLEEESK